MLDGSVMLSFDRTESPASRGPHGSEWVGMTGSGVRQETHGTRGNERETESCERGEWRQRSTGRLSRSQIRLLFVHGNQGELRTQAAFFSDFEAKQSQFPGFVVQHPPGEWMTGFVLLIEEMFRGFQESLGDFSLESTAVLL